MLVNTSILGWCVVRPLAFDKVFNYMFSREIQRTLMELLNQMDGFDVLGKVGMRLATLHDPLFSVCQMTTCQDDHDNLLYLTKFCPHADVLPTGEDDHGDQPA